MGQVSHFGPTLYNFRCPRARRFFCIAPSHKNLSDMSDDEKARVWRGTEKVFGSFDADHEWTGTRVPGWVRVAVVAPPPTFAMHTI